MSSDQQQSPGDSKDSRAPGQSGAGGKSLLLMQQRLLPPAASAPPPPPDPTPVAQPSPTGAAQRPGKSAANLIATQAKQQAAAVQAQAVPQPNPHPVVTQPQSVLPPGRPKGKDFAAMAKSVGSTPVATAPSPSPSPYPPTPNPMQPQPQQQGPPGPGGRPKGKDFAAMTNRMGGPVPTGPPASTPGPPPQQMQMQQTPQLAAAQAARAAQMQAAARAAAGYTPNQRSQPPANAQPAVHPLTVVPTPASNVPPSALAIADHARQQQLTKVKPPLTAVMKKPVASTPTNRRTSSSGSTTSGTPTSRPTMATQRSSSGSKLSQQPAPVVMATTTTPDFGPPSTKPTAQPSSSEAKLASGPGAAHLSPMVGQRLRELVASLDPNYTLDAEAEEQLLHLADDFLEKVTKQSMRLAHHRGSKTLDVPDIQLALAKQWGIVIPGLGVPIMRPSKPANRAMAAGSSTAALSANSTTTETDDAKKRTAESVSNGSTVKKAKMEGVGGGAPASLAAPATGFR